MTVTYNHITGEIEQSADSSSHSFIIVSYNLLDLETPFEIDSFGFGVEKDRASEIGVYSLTEGARDQAFGNLPGDQIVQKSLDTLTIIRRLGLDESIYLIENPQDAEARPTWERRARTKN